MKLLVTTKYGDKEIDVVNVTVGDGSKTFKWLGNAVAQRCANTKAPRGTSRQRDKHHVPYNTMLLPSAIYASDSLGKGKIYHPDSVIAEELVDGQAITVVLSEKQPVDPNSSCPVMEPFSLLAYRTNSSTSSTASNYHTEALAKALAHLKPSSSSSFKSSVPAAAAPPTAAGPTTAGSRRSSSSSSSSSKHRDSSSGNSSSSHHHQSSHHNERPLSSALSHTRRASFKSHGQRWEDGKMPNLHMMTTAAMFPEEPLSPEEREKRIKMIRGILDIPTGTQTWVANTFSRVWDKIIMGKTFHSLGMPYDEDLLGHLKAFTLINYPLILEVFTSFCSKDGKMVNKEGHCKDQQCLSFLGFKTIIYHLNFQCADASDLLHIIFDRASSCEAKDFTDRGMDITSFIVALMDVACTQTIDVLLHQRMSNFSPISILKQRQSLIQRNPNRSSLPSIYTIFKQCLEENLKTYAQTHLMEFLINQEIILSEGLALGLAEYHPTLSRVFSKVAGKPLSPFAPQAMTYFSFQQLALEYGLIDEGDEDAMKCLKIAYIAAKRDPPAPSSPSSTSPKAADRSTSPSGSATEYDDRALEDASFMLVYPEFVGGLLRLGLGGKYDDASLGLSDRLLATICLLLHAINSQRGGAAPPSSSTLSSTTTVSSSGSAAAGGGGSLGATV